MNPDKIKKYSLYKILTPAKAKLYSSAKLGHVPSLKKVSREMARFISKKMPSLDRKNALIYTTNKSPVDDSCKKSSLLIAENVAKVLNLPLLVGEYSHVFSDVKYYNQKKSFRKTPVRIPFFKNKLNYHGRQIMVIDDAIVTGMSLKESLNKLFKITQYITFFSIIALAPKKQLELELNNYLLKNNSYSILPKIAMEKGYRFTTQMLRTIDDSPPLELKSFINKISHSRRRQLARGFKNFFGRSLRVD